MQRKNKINYEYVEELFLRVDGGACVVLLNDYCVVDDAGQSQNTGQERKDNGPMISQFLEPTLKHTILKT